MQKWWDLNLSTCRNNDFCVCLLKFRYKIIPKNSKKKKIPQNQIQWTASIYAFCHPDRAMIEEFRELEGTY